MKSLASQLALLCVMALASTAPAGAQAFNSVNGHWYLRVDDTVTWTQANAAAQTLTFHGLNGYLATITSQDENDFAVANLGGFSALNSHWLGGYQDTSAPDYSEPAGGWKWVTGETWAYTSWFGPFEPNNYGGAENFVAYEHQPGAWNDLSDVPKDGYVVEFSGSVAAVPEPGAAATFGVAFVGLTCLMARRRGKRK